MTAYEQGFMKTAKDLGIGRDIAYGMLKSAVSRPANESERNERRKRINKIMATVMLGLAGATAGASINGIAKGSVREDKVRNDRHNKWWNETKIGTPDREAAWNELTAPLPDGTYRASDFAKGGLAGALLGGLLGYGGSSLGNYLSDYVGVDPMLPTVRVER